MTDDDLQFAIALDGSVTINGQVVEKPEADILDELPPAGAPPENPELQRLQAELDSLEPFRPLIEGIGRGTIEIRDAAAGPDPAQITGYRMRISAPDALEIAADMRLFQERLSSEDAQRLEDDPAYFNETFDKFRSLRPPVQPKRTGPSREEVERVLAVHEVRKDAARTVHPGTAIGSEAFGYQVDHAAAEIEAAKAGIRRSPSSTSAAARLARAMGLGLVE